MLIWLQFTFLFCYQVSLMINSLMPNRFHFHITLYILAISTLSLWLKLFFQGHVWLPSQPITLYFLTAMFFFPPHSTHTAHHTFKLPFSLSVRCFSLRLKPCAHVWFRYKQDAKSRGDQTYLRIRHLGNRFLRSHQLDCSNWKLQWIRFWSVASSPSRDQRPTGVKAATLYMGKSPHCTAVGRQLWLQEGADTY